MDALLQGNPPPRLPPETAIAIVCSSYYRDLIASMEGAARGTLGAAGVPAQSIRTVNVPGSFEIPLACRQIAMEGTADGILALGVIIQGETHHAAEIARACTDGLMQVQLAYGIPIIHEVIFAPSFALAEERCMGRKNKGTEAARALATMLALFPMRTRTA